MQKKTFFGIVLPLTEKKECRFQDHIEEKKQIIELGKDYGIDLIHLHLGMSRFLDVKYDYALLCIRHCSKAIGM